MIGLGRTSFGWLLLPLALSANAACGTDRDGGGGIDLATQCEAEAGQLSGCYGDGGADEYVDACGRGEIRLMVPMPCPGPTAEGMACTSNVECGDAMVCRPTSPGATSGACLPLGGARHSLPEGTCGDLCDSAYDCADGLGCTEGMCVPDGAMVASAVACGGFDPAASLAYLAGRSADWQAERECGLNCHTTVPFLLTGALHGAESTAAATALLSQAEGRVATWASLEVWYDDAYGAGKEAESRGTEAVLNAVTILRRDALAGTPSDAGRDALRILWEEQQADGSWAWLDFGLIPWEVDEARATGMTYALLAAASMGPEYLATTEEPAATGLARLRDGLRGLLTDTLHNKLMLLWAASAWPDLLSAEEQGAIIREARAAQLAEGGWNLGELGQWRVQETYPVGTSTVFATGLATYVLQLAGVPSSDPAIVDACDWLMSQQTPSGAFADTSMNRDREFNHLLIGDAATALAVLALDAATGG